MNIGNMTIPSTSTKAGRKIDTWSYSLHTREKISIDIILHSSESDGIYFRAASKDPLFKDQDWRNTDLECLREEVTRDVEAIVLDAVSDRWASSIMVESQPLDLGRSDLSNEYSFGISITCEAMRVDTQTPRGNQGERRVIRKGFHHTIIERSCSDKLDIDGSLEQSNTSIKFLETASRVLIDDTPDAREDIRRIDATIKSFTTQLMERMSPRAPGSDILPSPEDLAEMMRVAAQKVG